MKVIADLCVVPLGVGLSVSEYVAACERVLESAGNVQLAPGKIVFAPRA